MVDSDINPEEYLYLVDEVLTTRKYRRILAAFRIEYDDAYQIGSIGLLSAIKVYDPNRGTFQAIAVLRIRTELNHYFRRINQLKRKPSLHPLSLNMPLRDESKLELLDTIADSYETPVFDNVLTDIMMDKLQAPEKQVLQLLLYYEGIGSQRRSYEHLKISRWKYRNILKLLKQQVREIFDYSPERRTASV